MTRTSAAERIALAVLWVAVLAAAVWAVAPLVEDLRSPPPRPSPPVLPPDVVPVGWLAPGRWLLPDDDADPDPVRGTAFARSDPPDLSALPAAPVGVPLAAVRVGTDGRATAALYGPADAPATVAVWQAAGWTADARTAGGLPEYRLRRADAVALAWAVGGYLLVTPAVLE